MNIALHDGDGQRFPNLALMKLSAWHRARGDAVEWWFPLKTERYDRVYSSQVFSWRAADPMLPPDVETGGTGYGDLGKNLPPEIDAMPPDYSLYPDCDYALGFLTRGCPNACPWCVVPEKEGAIHAYRDWREIARPAARDMVLMDNNILACDYGVDQLASLAGSRHRIDFNQGLDARRIDAPIAARLASLHWMRHLRLACDSPSMKPIVERAIGLLRTSGIAPTRIMVYCLIRDDISEALDRIEFIRSLGATPFAQPYRDWRAAPHPPSVEQRHLARWCNHKAIFKTCTFSEYRG